ncbi:hypothetical protein NQT74_15960 [Alteromonas stellipolaris]|uniref:hypothetical protein n=1 Tax=Alteromonas stellipolaris TaxID=233316 RepID=UPI00211783D8|nr:hypothetical protein [Alteromonas stellipolaris]MCQ8850084.1 hypothetical protein [Alteromonas stellipolaris]
MNKNVAIILRSIAAIVGGYALSALLSIYLTYSFVHLLHINKGVAVLTASMMSYVVFFILFISSFAVSNIVRWLISCTLIVALAVLFLPLVEVL